MLIIWVAETTSEVEECLAFFTINLDGAFLPGFPKVHELDH